MEKMLKAMKSGLHKWNHAYMNPDWFCERRPCTFPACFLQQVAFCFFLSSANMYRSVKYPHNFLLDGQFELLKLNAHTQIIP